MASMETQILVEPGAEQVTVHPGAATRAWTLRPSAEIPRRVGAKALCRIVRQLSTLLHAGMPLVPALSAMAEQMQCAADGKAARRRAASEPLAAVIGRIRDDVNEGYSLAEALNRRKGLFPPMFINMVAAGEKSGALEEVLSRLAEMMERRVQLTSKVKSAVAYPAMMAVVAVGVVGFLLSYVVPSITRLFIEMNQTLPGPTRWLIAVSGFARAHMLLLLTLPCLAATAFYAVRRTQEGRQWTDRLILALPLFGPLAFKLEVARLTRTLGTCMKSGIPVLGAIEIAQRIVQNGIVAQAVGATRELVQKGETVANAVRSTGIFPPVVFHLIATGQMTGRLEDSLTDIAEMYEIEIETTVRTLTSLLEPLILLLMGGVVGFIVLAILLPIFEINQAL